MVAFVSWLPGDSDFGDSGGHMKAVSPSWEQGGCTGGTQKPHKVSVQVLLLYSLGNPAIPIFLH